MPVRPAGGPSPGSPNHRRKGTTAPREGNAILTRNAYIDSLKQTLEDWNAAITQVENLHDDVAEPEIDALDARLDQMRRQRDAVYQTLNEIQEAAETEWRDRSASVQRDLEEISAEFDDALEAARRLGQAH